MWKNIPAFGGRYEVSETGQIRHIENKNIRKQRMNKFGYLQINIPKNDGTGKSKTVLIHKVVAEAFIPNPLKLPQVNHIDGNKQNNHVSNLEWCDASENQKHAYKIGLSKPYKGVDNKRARFTREQITIIRKLYNEEHFSQQKIADFFNVSQSTIGKIIRGVRYGEC